MNTNLSKIAADTLLEKLSRIHEENGKYVLKSKDGSKVLGTHSTREKALAQERAIQASKAGRRKKAEDTAKGTQDALKRFSQVPFVDRIVNAKSYPVRNNPDGTHSTHLMSSAEVDGLHIAYPTLTYQAGPLRKGQSPWVERSRDDALDYALETGNYVPFSTPSGADSFAKGSWKSPSKGGLKKSSSFSEDEAGILIPPPPSEVERVFELVPTSEQYRNRKNPESLQNYLDADMEALFIEVLKSQGIDYDKSRLVEISNSLVPIVSKHKEHFNSLRPDKLAAKYGVDFSFDYLPSAQTPSYPSGHTAQAYYLAMVLSSEHPGASKELFKLADSVANSRIDRGVHVPSDNEAGKQLASEVFRIRSAKNVEKTADGRTAVIIKGNPDSPVDRKDELWDGYYARLRAILEGEGYSVKEDPGLPNTSPDKADVWVGHSRGSDRLRFAPEGTLAIPLGSTLKGAINHPGEKAFINKVLSTPGYAGMPLSERPQAPAEHLMITDKMEKELIARLAAFGKTAAEEFAPGIPKSRKIDALPSVQKARWDLSVQEHKADRAGKHWDIRLVDPATQKAHSWAVPKAKWPGAKNRLRLAIQQPTHTADYALNFEGSIPQGTYGSGKVKIVKKTKVVVDSSKDSVKFKIPRMGDMLLRRTDGNKWLLMRKKR